MPHYSCWSQSRQPSERPVWQGTWPTSPGTAQDQNVHDPENQPEQFPKVLALGVGGGTLQAIQDEIVKLNLRITIYAISSVIPQRIPGDDSATALLAAEATWGTRIVSPMRTLEWLSPEYRPSGRGRPASRRLLLGQIPCNRPWAPLNQPTIMVAGRIESQVGILVEEENIEDWRNLVTRANRISGDLTCFSYREILFRADCPHLGQDDIAPNIVQVEIGSPAYTSPETLQAHLLSLLDGQTSDPQANLWWLPDAAADFIMAPTSSNSIPAIVREIRGGLAGGFPTLRICASRYGIITDGVNPSLVPGLLPAVGLGAPQHGLDSLRRGPMHYPFRVAKQGRSHNSAYQEWRVLPACVDNDVLLVIDDITIPAERARDAIAQTIAQPCAVSEVMTIGDTQDPSHAAWLIRIPAAGRAEVQQWQARNGTLMIDGRRVQTRPAPPTCAKYPCQNGSQSTACMGAH